MYITGITFRAIRLSINRLLLSNGKVCELLIIFQLGRTCNLLRRIFYQQPTAWRLHSSQKVSNSVFSIQIADRRGGLNCGERVCASFGGEPELHVT